MGQKNEELLKFNAEVGKVLQLMIHSLYTNKDIFLRELISNASDACDKLRYEALTNPKLAEGESALKIDISIDKVKKQLIISDNGIGMSREELITHLGTIAKSGTQEFASKLTGDAKKDAVLIGQFGVGFYSGFMVADEVNVVSTKAGENQTHIWKSTGTGEFTIAQTDSMPRGTTVTLHLKETAQDYLDKFRLRHIIETYSNHISFPISLTDEEAHTETINTGSALWTRTKNEITPEQYNEFYFHVSHSPDEPWLTMHNKNEGKLEYTNLLFIPSIKPFDLFHPDRKRRVKLYVKRVFITEENIDLVPSYLRFLRGIVDSQDLPLNISRETLQANPILANIKEAITKRVISELKKKSEGADYQPFWDNFGAVLKEGLCESYSPREQILEVCRFASTSEDSTSLDAYISRMKEGQENIFYITGESALTVKSSPQLEGFKARGIEVLLLSDHVDDFWVTVVADYKGKKFKSITRADIDLDKIAKADKPEEKPAATDKIDALIKRFKEVLGTEVKEVRTTTKLGTSAVCLAVEEGAMDFRLEKFLREQKQLENVTAKILEINPAHPIIKALSSTSGDISDTVWVLFDQAKILEGENVTDPAAFTRRLQTLVEKGLAA
jgi:molecular chaperone HtpG